MYVCMCVCGAKELVVVKEREKGYGAEINGNVGVQRARESDARCSFRKFGAQTRGGGSGLRSGGAAAG